MKTRYGVSPWIHSFPDARRPSFDQFRGDNTADIVIVGGGLTGCATAYALAAAGRRPLLLEAGRIGHGSAGRGGGLLLSEPGPPFRELVQHHGLRATRIILEGWKKAVTDATALMRRLGIRGELTGVESVIAASGDAARRLRKEFDSRDAAGLESAWLDARKLAQLTRVDADAGMRVRGGFALDPYRVCVGLVRAAVKNRGRVFERSPVDKIVAGAKDVEIVVRGARIRTALVIVTTGSATTLFKPLQRHFTPRERYAVLTEPIAAPIRKQLFGATLTLRLENAGGPSLRWTSDHRLVLSGAEQDEITAAKRPPVLVQRTGQLMYELLTTYPAISGLRPEYGWEIPFGRTADGLMYVGPHRNYPRHLFALGGTGDSVADAFVAARVLTRAAQGAADKSDQLLGWTR